MKKRVITLIMAFVCVVICVFGLVACGSGDGACEHDFQRTTVFHEATCTEDAYYETKCTKCGEKGENSFYSSANGHGFNTSYVYNNDETCTKNGTRSRMCFRCNKMITTEVPNSAKHIFNGTRDCERCNAQIENKYLKYELNAAGDGYIVSCDLNTNSSSMPVEERQAIYSNMSIINIPAQYNNLPVVEIKDGAFSDNLAGYAAGFMSVVYIPSTVKRIGNDAFQNKGCLLKVIFEEDSQLESIGNYAFQSTMITELNLPEGVTTLSEYALCGMKYLTCVTLPQSLTQIGESMFSSDIRLNTIINHSDFPMTQADIRTYFNYGDDVNPRLEVRESNPNHIAVKNHTNTSNHEVPVYFSYMRLDGENILTSIFSDGDYISNGQPFFSNIEVPYGITQVDTIVFRNISVTGSLVLPGSVKKINKVTSYDHFGNYNYDTTSKVIQMSEYTDISDFEESDYTDSNGINHLQTYKDENSPYCVEYYFHDLWASLADSDYVFKKNGITITFAEHDGASLDGIGEIYQQTADELAHVYFGDTSLTIFIEIDDGAELSVQSLALQGHTTGLNDSSVYLRGMYFDKDADDYRSGMRETWSFNRTDHMYSYREFDEGDYKNSTKWKFDLWTNKLGNYSYSLRSIRITFEKSFNDDLTEA